MREYKAEFLGLRVGEIGRHRKQTLVVHGEDAQDAEHQLSHMGFDRVLDLVLTEQPIKEGLVQSKPVLIPDPPAPIEPVAEPVAEPVVEAPAEPDHVPAEISEPAPPSPRKTRTRKAG
jgi:hypothetical protein